MCLPLEICKVSKDSRTAAVTVPFTVATSDYKNGYETFRRERGGRSENTVPELLDKRDHFQDLLLLLVGEFPPFLDQPAHPYDLHALVLC